MMTIEVRDEISKLAKKGKTAEYIQSYLRGNGHDYPLFLIEEELSKGLFASGLIERSTKKLLPLWAVIPLLLFCIIGVFVMPSFGAKLFLLPCAIVLIINAWDNS